MPVEPSVPGRVTCLSCGKSFRSPDRLRIRRCARCKKEDAKLSARDLGSAGGDWPASDRPDLWRD